MSRSSAQYTPLGARYNSRCAALVGWLRVSLSPFDGPPRVYDGSVPAILSPQMITAALARLDFDWIEAHTADVNIGN